MKTNHVSGRSKLNMQATNKKDHSDEDQIVVLYPPPADLRCEICGTHVSELEKFDDFTCSWFTDLEHLLALGNPNVRVPRITPDFKLAKRSRGIDETTVSWECTNCFFLEDEDVYRQDCNSSQEN